MSSKSWLYLLGAIGTEVTASLCLKAALIYPVLYVVVALGYVSAFTCLSFALRSGMALGVAYGVWGATGVALTAIFSRIFFGEPMTLLMGVGIFLIMCGVVLVELGAQESAQTEDPEITHAKVVEALSSESKDSTTTKAATAKASSARDPQGGNPA